MAQFIEVTRFVDSEKILMNIEHIKTVYKGENGAIIYFGATGRAEVKESYNDVKFWIHNQTVDRHPIAVALNEIGRALVQRRY